jgi:hypothetical protein
MLKRVRIDRINLRACVVTFFLISALCLNLSCKSDGDGVVGFIEPTVDGLVDEGEYTKSKSLGGLFGNYKIYWSSDESFFYIALKAKTDGWVAVGFQPEPGDIKKDVDFILGYVSNGEAFVFDLFSERAEGPHRFDESLGGSNNIIDYDGSENDGYTVIEFKRVLNTSDPYDYIVTPGSVNILWSYSPDDDISEAHEGHRGYSTIDF